MFAEKYYCILLLISSITNLLEADKLDVHHHFMRKDIDYIVTNENCYIEGCGGLILPFISAKLSPKSITLWCNVSDTINDSIEKWYKDGRMITDDDINYEVSYHNKNRSSSLEILKSSPSDIGTFTCETVNKYNASIKTRLRPFLEPFEEYYKNNYKSANLYEGERFSLECKPMDLFSLDVNVTWFIYDYKLFNYSINDNNPEIDYENLIPIIGDNDGRIKIEGNDSARTLTIEETELSDRAYYVCIGDNGIAIYNNTIFLRVKDKWKMLYPASIIGIELSVLCIFMLCYEKFRKKEELDVTITEHLSKPLSKTRGESLKKRK